MEITVRQCQRCSGDSVESVFYIDFRIPSSYFDDGFPSECDKEWRDIGQHFSVRFGDQVAPKNAIS